MNEAFICQTLLKVVGSEKIDTALSQGIYDEKLNFKVKSYIKESTTRVLNIARGTTDPGYRVYNSRYLSS